MPDKPTLTTESGASVADNQNSQVAAAGGPTLLQGHYLIEKLARFNRECIPERIVHAVGTVPAHDLVALAADAARNGDEETMQRALDAGVAVCAATHRGDSLLMLAAYHGHASVVRLLLARGADPDQPDAMEQSPLAGVAFKGLVDIAELLVGAGADIDRPSPDGWTPLSMAAAFNRLEMVEWLLQHGASPEMRDVHGLRPIDIAKSMGAAGAVRVLSRDVTANQP